MKVRCCLEMFVIVMKLPPFKEPLKSPRGKNKCVGGETTPCIN